MLAGLCLQLPTHAVAPVALQLGKLKEWLDKSLRGEVEARFSSVFTLETPSSPLLRTPSRSRSVSQAVTWQAEVVVPLRERLQDCHCLAPDQPLTPAESDVVVQDLRRTLGLALQLGSKQGLVVEDLESASLQDASDLCLRLALDCLPRCHGPPPRRNRPAEAAELLPPGGPTEPPLVAIEACLAMMRTRITQSTAPPREDLVRAPLLVSLPVVPRRTGTCVCRHRPCETDTRSQLCVGAPPIPPLPCTTHCVERSERFSTRGGCSRRPKSAPLNQCGCPV